jgi:hypothetical protein
MVPAMSMGFVVLAISFIRVGREMGFSWLVLGFGFIGLRGRSIRGLLLGGWFLAIPFSSGLVRMVDSIIGPLKDFKIGIVLSICLRSGCS